MPLSTELVTLNGFINQQERKFPGAHGTLSGLLRSVGLAAKIVNRELNKAGLVDILGDHGATNVQGETVKKMDVFANEHFIAAFKRGRRCCGIVSEEDEDLILTDEHGAQYLICMDPLDGSSNIDVNVGVGTIFSIFKRLHNDHPVSKEDFLQKGVAQVAAGYVIYGTSTMLIYTAGNGVNGFTLDPTIGEFCLSHPDMQMPKNGNIVSVNMGYIQTFPDAVKNYVNACTVLDKSQKKPYSIRYIGSMVADLHRTMLKGGIFMYPSSTDAPNGKLRLLYECNPLSFIVEQAGGKATNGKIRIMEMQPEALHQRTPIYIGSTDMVDDLMQHFNASI